MKFYRFKAINPTKNMSIYVDFTHENNYTQDEFNSICSDIIESRVLNNVDDVFDILIKEYNFKKFIFEDHVISYNFETNNNKFTKVLF